MPSASDISQEIRGAFVAWSRAGYLQSIHASYVHQDTLAVMPKLQNESLIQDLPRIDP
jgi:hypothetical protein